MNPSLKSQAVRGFTWTAAEAVMKYGMNFIVLLVLARLLTPADVPKRLFLDIPEPLIREFQELVGTRAQGCPSDRIERGPELRLRLVEQRQLFRNDALLMRQLRSQSGVVDPDPL